MPPSHSVSSHIATFTFCLKSHCHLHILSQVTLPPSRSVSSHIATFTFCLKSHCNLHVLSKVILQPLRSVKSHISTFTFNFKSNCNLHFNHFANLVDDFYLNESRIVYNIYLSRIELKVCLAHRVHLATALLAVRVTYLVIIVPTFVSTSQGVGTRVAVHRELNSDLGGLSIMSAETVRQVASVTVTC